MNECVCQRVDISVYGDTARICACTYNFCQQKKGHRKLNKAHFLFKLFKQRHRLWRWQQSWIMMSYCTCIRDMKQLVGGGVFSKHWHVKSARASVVGINQVKVPHWVQSTFLYTISGVQFRLELKRKKKKKRKPQGQSLIASEKHYFYVSVCPKMNVLEGKRKSAGEKKTLKREKSIIQECKTIMHHSQIQ